MPLLPSCSASKRKSSTLTQTPPPRPTLNRTVSPHPEATSRASLMQDLKGMLRNLGYASQLFSAFSDRTEISENHWSIERGCLMASIFASRVYMFHRGFIWVSRKDTRFQHLTCKAVLARIPSLRRIFLSSDATHTEFSPRSLRSVCACSSLMVGFRLRVESFRGLGFWDLRIQESNYWVVL